MVHYLYLTLLISLVPLSSLSLGVLHVYITTVQFVECLQGLIPNQKQWSTGQL
ncbi:hypothetical protein BDV37DRAFT_264684 [Aspergillus pseudonomiae]|uniref:Uncharacterized protein n=1 Tax=Aspergillus pseudonomiae TaxID=1506151 RepID=A0A5N7CUI8_9EURO|nr:uncharacterized protein BDV37DRAFT_264684 [Aspergillus pseudonomiae]KAE8397865.1 hypothetical protein BDV37DRAFT_264684 [Aspergillus pseudonomiae]